MADAKIKSISAPIGGWNARDSIDQMAESDAVILENWIPRSGRLELRGGYTSYATTLGADVRTLAEYSYGATRKFLAGANGNLWNISAAGAGVSLGSGFSEDYWDHANMNGVMILVNGTDFPQEFDGSSISSATVSGTGLTATTLITVTTHRNRNYYIEKNALSFWHTAVNAHAGTLTEFPLNMIAKKGGHLMAIGSWTRDSGSGPDDTFVAVTSMGEVIVYQGSDPSDAGDWYIIGSYITAPPLGRRCILNIGGELIILTKDGYVPMSALTGGIRADEHLVSNKIRGEVIKKAITYNTNQGWEAIFYPRGGYTLFNVPITVDKTYEQHVVNTSDIPGSWAKFTNINARCFGIYNDRLYFGDDGVVYLFDDGYADNGTNIETDAMPAYNYMGTRARIKQFTGFQPVLQSDGDISPSVSTSVDFNTPGTEFTASTVSPSGVAWDDEDWDVPDWAGLNNNTSRQWLAANDIGYTASVRMRTRTKGQQLYWYSQNWMFRLGNII